MFFKYFFKCITNLLLIIIFCLFGIVLYGYYQLEFQKKDYVNVFGYSYFEVITGSMEPNINVNDLVIVKLNTDDYEVGDVITYRLEDAFVTHRVIEKNDSSVVCKGDNNNTNDKAINKDQVLGKVIKVIPDVGVIKQAIMTPKVMLSFLITIILFGIYFKEKDKSNNKKKEEVEDET